MAFVQKNHLDRLYPSQALTHWEKGLKPIDSKEVVLSKLSDVYISQIDQDRIPRFLARMSRLRVAKSFQHDTDNKILEVTPFSNLDEFHPLEPSLGERKYGIISPSTGRKVFLPSHQVFSSMFRLPDSIGEQNKGIISVKGLGSPLRTMRKSDLVHKQQIKGLTQLDGDQILEYAMRNDGQEIVMTCRGERKEWKFIPGRYFIGAVPIEQMTVEGEVININELDPKEYPLLTGENTPYIIFHNNWSTYNFIDIVHLSDVISERNDKDLDEWAREYLEKITRQVQVDLQSHPHFMEVKDTETNSLTNWWAKFLVAQLEKGYAEAQILHKRGIQMPNRHMQNSAFGGQEDYGGSPGELRVNIWNDYLYSIWENDVDLSKAIMRVLSASERENLLQQIGEASKDWDKKLLDSNMLVETIRTVASRTNSFLQKENFNKINRGRMTSPIE